VQAKADSEHWRKKYFDALRSLEQEEKGFRSLEGLLRRLVNRLCFAALGLTPQLDAEVNRLTDAMRRKVGEAELERLFAPLSDAIAALDQRSRSLDDSAEHPEPAAGLRPVPVPTPVVAAAAAPVAGSPAAVPIPTAQIVVLSTVRSEFTRIDVGASRQLPPESLPPRPAGADPADDFFGEERVRAVLSRLLQEVRRNGALAIRANEIEALLLVSLTREQLPVVMSQIADLMAQRIAGIEKEKQDVESLLGQITSRLDEISQYIVGEDQDRALSLENTQELNARLVSEMHDLGSSVDASVDIAQVKLKVRSRLDTIGAHLQEFQSREETRARSHWDRSEKMRERVERLETEARDLHDRLRDEQRLAMVDALTQIPNRLAYDQRLGEEFKRFQRFNQPTCIAAWDLDNFKKINDAYGHRAGDKVLRVVADCFQSRLRETDFLARYGGEEFVVIFSGTGPEDARRVAEEMREAVAALGFHFRSMPVSVSVSCGITAFREGDSADDAFDRADKALYLAKENGRNRCVVS
jgi:diguanylate cyclase